MKPLMLEMISGQVCKLCNIVRQSSSSNPTYQNVQMSSSKGVGKGQVGLFEDHVVWDYSTQAMPNSVGVAIAR